ncbi:MAG TPA: hypothetical protein EYP60_01895 [bacterium (Candidatus Stahlbacteria)]|nr:hypothetical protein [Candidatus Stahlbacteria bacterium]
MKFLNNYAVHSLYGKLKYDEIGGGRPACNLSEVTEEFAARYIKKARSFGLNFNYLLNASCIGNKEFTKSGYRSIIDRLSWLEEMGVNYITVSIPYLGEIIRTRFPQFKIAVSKLAFVSSAQKAKYWEDIGADQIVLDINIIRDFKKLEQIRDCVGIDLVLLVNDACLFDCPYAHYHANLNSHASQTDYSGTYVNYCRFFCAHKFLENPIEIVKSMFIRPEDLHFYEDIGITRFKITDRIRPTHWIVNVLDAYSRRSYNGNLADLLGPHSSYGKNEDLRIVNPWEIGNFEELEEMRKTDLFRPNVYIDNKKLEGFLDFFRTGNCETRHCDECKHCEEYTNRAVSIDGTKKDIILKNLKAVLDWLKTGDREEN